MRGTAFLVIGLFAVGLLPISSGFAQENDYLIVPGQRVGRWELGKPLDAYGFGQGGRWEGTTGGRAYYDGYSFRPAPGRPRLQLYACRSDSLVFAVLVVRRLELTPEPDAEDVKYRTPGGVRIGMDESEAVRLLGQPEHTSQFTERHGQFEVLVRQLEYRGRGLFVRINRADLKVLALGAMREGGFQACQQAVLGRPAAAQTPAPVNPLFQETDYRIVPGQRTGKIDLGRPIDAYGLGRPYGQWEGEASRIPYYDGYHYSLPVTDARLQVEISTCRDDGLVFAVLLW